MRALLATSCLLGLAARAHAQAAEDHRDAELIASGHNAEVIEIDDRAPAPAGETHLEAKAARATAGAFGEPTRALAMLPGVVTSSALVPYPIIRGTLPGESRFDYDGIEIPMLYHLFLAGQVIHPAMMSDLQLRAGGADASHGFLVGGLIEMTPAAVIDERTELDVNPLAIGAFHARRLSPRTTLAIAGHLGTLTLFARVAGDVAIDYLDQQTRLVHTLPNGDQLAITSIGALDNLGNPPGLARESYRLGFHRLDLRWTSAHTTGGVRAGIQTELDTLGHSQSFAPSSHQEPPPVAPGEPFPDPSTWKTVDVPAWTARERSSGYGARGYADGHLRVAPWLDVRGGIEGRHRRLINRGAPLIDLGGIGDPYLGLARKVDTSAAWAGAALTLGSIAIAPSVRIDHQDTELYDVDVHTTSLDPRLAITAALPAGASLELAGGAYSAPPQVSVIEPPIVVGPLPSTTGTGALAGLNRSYQAQAALRMPLDAFGHAGAEASFAAYAKRTAYAIDFDSLSMPFSRKTLCDFGQPTADVYVYRDVTARAMGFEAMARGQLSRTVSGWASYTLGKIDRDLGFAKLPSSYDQRHTLNATVQWRKSDDWSFGATAMIRSGRPAMYPRIKSCPANVPLGVLDGEDYIDDPTHLRRTPMMWRFDLRAEHVFHRGAWTVRGYLELQNATLSRDVYGYDIDVDIHGYKIVESSFLLPLPFFGVVFER